MQRIAIIADIHGNLPALEAVAADIHRRAISNVMNLGDHISGPLWPAETLAFLMQQPWIHIAGNHDRQLVQQPPAEHGASDRYAFAQLDRAQLEWLRRLPAYAQPSGTMLLCHGTPATDEQYLLETIVHGITRLALPGEIQARLAGADASVVLCGHSHIARVVNLDGRLLVNPGSVGLPAYRGMQPAPHSVDAGSPAARYAVLEPHERGWRVELIALPYDHHRAARQARRNDQPEWELALATGYISS